MLSCWWQEVLYFVGGFLKRNFGRWVKQYEASKTREIENMNTLIKWVKDHLPNDERCTVIHGDFRYEFGKLSKFRVK